MWDFVMGEEAQNDFKNLDGSQKKITISMLEKLKMNPLPNYRGGYGTPLGNDHSAGNLTNLLKIKARGAGIRIVYQLIEEEGISKIIVIGLREEKEVYKTAVKRINKY